MMKKALALIILALCLGTTAFSLDLGLFFDIGNLDIPDGTTAGDNAFPGTTFPWGLEVYGSQKASDTTGIDVSFYVDPILRNISYTLFNYGADFFSIGVGPFFGFFNTRETVLKSGISTSFRAEIPGVVFVSFRADSSIGGGLERTGDYTQERNDVSLGYYVKNAICSANLFTRRYAELDATLGKVIDGFTEYSFSTDIFQKNVPYRIKLNFAYQQRTKSFVDSTITHTLNSIVIGTEFDFQVNDTLTLIADLDRSVYSFGFVSNTTADTQDILDLSETWPGVYLFRARIGAKLHLDI